ncbi:MAG: NAD-binding protein [Halioglobus sp.]|nr:NAD-binding protein [Halioglobus sp.]
MSGANPNKKPFPWRSAGALFFFFGALIGFASGVTVSERPEVSASSLLTQAYYSLSLFVVGGVDLGTPQGGPFVARALVWVAYFGAPILTASTLIGAMLKAMAPQSWKLRRLRDHVIVVGAGELSLSYMRVLRAHNPRLSVVVVAREMPEQSVIDEFEQGLGAKLVIGDITHEFFLRQLQVERALKILFLSDNSLRSYEAASILLSMVPGIGERIVIHCVRLRFMRAMENTHVANSCETFNTYHLAAAGLVRDHLIQQFRETREKDVVIIAGFGRFGQTILEELQRNAQNELATVAIIERDAHRRILVAEEQMAFTRDYHRKVYEGDISHPEVWQRMRAEIEHKPDGENVVFVLGTGLEEDNLRTALWIRRNYPKALVVARSSRESKFAAEVAAEHDFISISINQLVEENIPSSWIKLGA